MIEVQGYKAFRGIMGIYIGDKEATVYGDFLYMPQHDCWYANTGESYPAEICRVIMTE